MGSDKLNGCEKQTVYLCTLSYNECKHYDPVESLFTTFRECRHLRKKFEPFQCMCKQARLGADIDSLKEELRHLEEVKDGK